MRVVVRAVIERSVREALNKSVEQRTERSHHSLRSDAYEHIALTMATAAEDTAYTSELGALGALGAL
jgi:hypothetical protein